MMIFGCKSFSTTPCSIKRGVEIMININLRACVDPLFDVSVALVSLHMGN
jgi:hypothetical protein